MKNTILVFLFLFLVHTIQGQIENDKVLHYVGGNLYGLAGAGIAKQISNGNRWWTFAGAIGGSTLIGLGKEAVDASQRENGWDNADLLATILGGATVGFTIDIFTDHKKKGPRNLARGTTFKKETTSWSVLDEDHFKKSGQIPTLKILGLPEGFFEIQAD
ncbi:hypothetical protein [Croceitalea sp. MTPC5]|uniref:hypothetical protein n=1 Tax=Croceitalea sp. MTPC5 TaxID=3056565 RepID=UPI0030D55287